MLKDDRKTDPERKRAIEMLLGSIASEQFATLVVRCCYVVEKVGLLSAEPERR